MSQKNCRNWLIQSGHSAVRGAIEVRGVKEVRGVIEVRGVGADAALLSLHSELDCVWTLWDSSSPERPEQPYGGPACV